MTKFNTETFVMIANSPVPVQWVYIIPRSLLSECNTFWDMKDAMDADEMPLDLQEFYLKQNRPLRFVLFQ